MTKSEPNNTFIPYGRQTITEADIQAVVKVLKSPYLTQGPVVPAFERAVAKKVGANYGVAVNSATSALHIACLALELGPGDWLWTSPITFVASANCGLYCGASVDFVDINPRTGLIDIEALASKLEHAEKQGKSPKVVVPVHLAGTSCDMQAIASLAERYGFSVLEDASHAIGGSYQAQPVGSCIHSSICVFSFHPVKIITTGEGGMATTNDPLLAQRMVDLRSHGITKDPSRFLGSPAGSWTYEQHHLGFNYRLTDFQAALGLSQIERLKKIILERNRQLLLYQRLVQDLPLRFLEIPSQCNSSVHLGIVRFKNQSADFHRHIFEYMRSTSIGVQLHYLPVHLQPYYRRLGFKEGNFPEAEKYAHNAMSLPLFPGLTKTDQQRVVSLLNEAMKTYA